MAVFAEVSDTVTRLQGAREMSSVRRLSCED